MPSLSARSWMRRIFSTVFGPQEPAFTVGSLAISATTRPSARPIPVTTHSRPRPPRPVPVRAVAAPVPAAAAAALELAVDALEVGVGPVQAPRVLHEVEH